MDRWKIYPHAINWQNSGFPPPSLILSTAGRYLLMASMNRRNKWQQAKTFSMFIWKPEAEFGWIFLWRVCSELYWCSSPTSPLSPASLLTPLTRRNDSLDSATNGRSDIDSGSGSSRPTSRQYSLDSRHSLSDRWVSVPPLQLLLLLYFLLLRPVTPSRCDVSGGLVPSSSFAVLACMRSYPISLYVYSIQNVWSCIYYICTLFIVKNCRSVSQMKNHSHLLPFLNSCRYCAVVCFCVGELLTRCVYECVVF